MLPLCAVLFWYGWTVYDTKVLKGGFWRFRSQEELFMWFEMPSGTDVEVVAESMYNFEKALMPIPDDVRMTTRCFAGVSGGWMRVEFEEHMLKTTVPLSYRALLIDQADRTGGASIFITGFSDRPYIKGGFGGSSLNSLVKITGYNSKKLSEIADKALARASKSRRVRNGRITTGEQYSRFRQHEMVISIHRERLATYGFTVTELVTQVRRLLGVDFPWMMVIDGEQERLQMAYDDSDEISYADISSMVIQNSTGERVRLGDLIEIEKREMSRTIFRENQKYTAYVNWEYLGTDQMRTRYIKDIVAGIQEDLPYGYHVEEGEQEFLTEEEEAELNRTLILSLAFIFMIMAAMFESVTLPILILTSVPMALVGVVLAFWWMPDTTFDSSARIGLILLFGIVVNNAILLVSRFRTEASLILKIKLGGNPSQRAALFPGIQKQLGGSDLWVLPREERAGLLRRAIARGTRIKLRPILLTSGTTIAGLVPLLIRLSDSEERDIWENLALTSIGGLAASTILILMVLPPLYYYCVRTGWTFRVFFGWLKRKLSRKARASALPKSPQEA
jgi:HAE1 family hydrophobic/amphiphilic exporter-1